MSLESAGSRLIPDRIQRQWLIAQSHLVERDGKLEDLELDAKISGTTFTRPETEFLGGKEAYEEVIGKIKATEPTPNSLFDHFISEKSLHVHSIHS